MPLSVIHTSLAFSHFEIIPFTSQGAMNWPFLILIVFPVSAAEVIRSVCLLRKAGICIISTKSFTLFACDGK